MVSCADILTGATRDAIMLVGGPYWMVSYDRKYAEFPLPWKQKWFQWIARTSLFQSQGLNVLDLVVISGILML